MTYVVIDYSIIISTIFSIAVSQELRHDLCPKGWFSSGFKNAMPYKLLKAIVFIVLFIAYTIFGGV